MPTEHLKPESLWDSSPYAFHQVLVSTGTRIIHCAGQTAWDRDMKLVGEGDLGAQADCCFDNITRALAAADAEPKDVVRLTLYVVGHKPEYLDTISAAITRFFAGHPPSANTLVGVQALALPEFLIEVEATAVVDEG